MKYLDVLRKQLNDLSVRRSAALEAMEAVTSAATAESRSALTDVEESQFATLRSDIAAIDTEADALRSRIGDLEAIETRAAADSARKAPIPGMHTSDPFDVRGYITDADARARALTAIERSSAFLSDDHRQHLAKKIGQRGSIGAAAARLTLVTGSEAYERGWSKYMSGNAIAMTEDERRALSLGRDTQAHDGVFGAESRAMSSGTGSTGGFFVPVVIDPTMVITGAGAVNPIRQLATVKEIGPAFGGWYGATAAQVTAAWTAEGAAAPDNTPTVTQPNIPVYMAEAFAGVSYQAFEDISDLAGDLLALFVDAKINLEAQAHQLGTGIGQPTGVMTAVAAQAGSRVASGTVNVLALADVFNVHAALPARFRNVQTQGGDRLAWLANVKIIDTIRQLAMAQNSANSIWTEINSAFPAGLLGNPILEASQLVATTTTGSDCLLYGDFSRYYIVDRIGFTTEFIPNLFDTATGRPTAQRGWISHWRTGANIVDANAFRDLRIA